MAGFSFGQKAWVIKLAWSEEGPYYSRFTVVSWAESEEVTVLQSSSELVAVVTEKGKVRFKKPEHVFESDHNARAFMAQYPQDFGSYSDLAEALGESYY